jgi:hypothetical protein
MPSLKVKINIAIGDESPSVYFPELADQCKSKKPKYGGIADLDELQANLCDHCVPEKMIFEKNGDYEGFVTERRKPMAAKMKHYFSKLWSSQFIMKRISVKRHTIRKLWQLCDKAVFAVPEIQREFVWDPRRASDLLDSIARQLPIGSLLVWRTTSDRKHLLRHAQEILPPHDSRNADIWFLIDGQQRLSVLYPAMRSVRWRRHGIPWIENMRNAVSRKTTEVFRREPMFVSHFDRVRPAFWQLAKKRVKVRNEIATMFVITPHDPNDPAPAWLLLARGKKILC